MTWLLVSRIPPLMTQWLKHTHSKFTGVVYSKSYLLKCRNNHGEALKSYCPLIPADEHTNCPCLLMVSPENFCKVRRFGGGRKPWGQPWEGGGNRNKSKDRRLPGEQFWGSYVSWDHRWWGVSGGCCVSVHRVAWVSSVLTSFHCQRDTTSSQLRRESQLRNCLDQIGPWEVFGELSSL